MFSSLGAVRKLILGQSSVVDIEGVPPEGLDISYSEFAPAFAALWESKGLTCKSSGKTVTGLPRPTTAILDVRSLYSW
jgi:hypothetical protein